MKKKPARAASLLPATAIPMSARLRAGASLTPTTQEREREKERKKEKKEYYSEISYF
jgi:hypothetical protein